MKTLLAIRTAQLGDATKLSDLVKGNIYQYHIGHYSRMGLGYGKGGIHHLFLKNRFRTGKYLSLRPTKYYVVRSNWIIKESKTPMLIQVKWERDMVILLEFVLGHSRSNGLKYLELESNKRVVPFYEKFHFRNTKKNTVTWEDTHLSSIK